MASFKNKENEIENLQSRFVPPPLLNNSNFDIIPYTSNVESSAINENSNSSNNANNNNNNNNANMFHGLTNHNILN